MVFRPVTSTPPTLKNDTIKTNKKDSTVDAPWAKSEKVEFLSVPQHFEARRGKASLG